MAKTTITPLARGPYLIKGPIHLLDGRGNEIAVERDPVALCRCGNSAAKPFCDGTHARIGFESGEQQGSAAEVDTTQR